MTIIFSLGSIILINIACLVVYTIMFKPFDYGNCNPDAHLMIGLGITLIVAAITSAVCVYFGII